jgi:hypothetical protein
MPSAMELRYIQSSFEDFSLVTAVLKSCLILVSKIIFLVHCLLITVFFSSC